MRDELVLAHGGSILQAHKGDHLLPPVPVWAANDRDFQYPRVAQQDFFDLARVDIAAAADDHVFGTVLER